jgi:hypothetical protein
MGEEWMAVQPAATAMEVIGCLRELASEVEMEGHEYRRGRVEGEAHWDVPLARAQQRVQQSFLTFTS